MDFGYPQYTEAIILSEFIKTNAYKMEVVQRPPMAVTNAVSWRSEGIKYNRNEVILHTFSLFFFDNFLYFCDVLRIIFVNVSVRSSWML